MAAEIGIEIGEEFGDGFKVGRRTPPAPLVRGEEELEELDALFC